MLLLLLLSIALREPNAKKTELAARVEDLDRLGVVVQLLAELPDANGSVAPSHQ